MNLAAPAGLQQKVSRQLPCLSILSGLKIGVQFFFEPLFRHGADDLIDDPAAFKD
jgi:hypothetical protein